MRQKDIQGMLKILSIFIGLACCLVGKSCFAQKEFEKKYYFALAEVVKGEVKTAYFSARLSYENKPNVNTIRRQFVKFLAQNYQLEKPEIKFTINKIGLKSPIRNLVDYRKAKILTIEYYKNREWKVVETDFGRED